MHSNFRKKIFSSQENSEKEENRMKLNGQKDEFFTKSEKILKKKTFPMNSPKFQITFGESQPVYSTCVYPLIGFLVQKQKTRSLNRFFNFLNSTFQSTKTGIFMENWLHMKELRSFFGDLPLIQISTTTVTLKNLSTNGRISYSNLDKMSYRNEPIEHLL